MTNPFKLLIIIAIATATPVAVFKIVSSLENKGASEARQEIQKQDMDAGNEATTARSELRRCIDAGGMQYDFATRKCSK